MIDVNIKKLFEDAVLPTYGSSKAACMDLYAYCPDSTYARTYTTPFGIETASYEGCVIPAHSTVKVGTGISMQPIGFHKVESAKGVIKSVLNFILRNIGFVGLIFARSGLATKHGLRPANCVGVVDEDYTGEIIVAVHNDTDMDEIIHHGDRIAQMMWLPFWQCNFIETNELDATDRGDGGFGHTGV